MQGIPAPRDSANLPAQNEWAQGHKKPKAVPQGVDSDEGSGAHQVNVANMSNAASVPQVRPLEVPTGIHITGLNAPQASASNPINLAEIADAKLQNPAGSSEVYAVNTDYPAQSVAAAVPYAGSRTKSAGLAEPDTAVPAGTAHEASDTSTTRRASATEPVASMTDEAAHVPKQADISGMGSANAAR